MNMQVAGAYLAECRRAIGLSQEALAERLNVSSRAVSNWENGKTIPKGETLLLYFATINASFATWYRMTGEGYTEKDAVKEVIKEQAAKIVEQFTEEERSILLREMKSGRTDVFEAIRAIIKLVK